METQINSYFNSKKGARLVRIFGYSTKGIPGLEINGVGKLSKNMKEKMIYLTRSRKLSVPLRRFVICVDLNDLEESISWQELKWLEFPILLLYWQLSGILPVSKLEDCLCSGTVLSNGEIYQENLPSGLEKEAFQKFSELEKMKMKLILKEGKDESSFWNIDPSLLLQHIPDLRFH